MSESTLKQVVAAEVDGAWWSMRTDGHAGIMRQASPPDGTVVKNLGSFVEYVPRWTRCDFVLVEWDLIEALRLKSEPKSEPTCAGCGGTGSVTCDECQGNGEIDCECDCGNEHEAECSDCDDGKVMCDCVAPGAQLTQSGAAPIRIAGFDGGMWDRRILTRVLAELPSSERVGVARDGDVLILRSGDTYGIAMGMRAQGPVETYPLVALGIVQSVTTEER